MGSDIANFPATGDCLHIPFTRTERMQQLNELGIHFAQQGSAKQGSERWASRIHAEETSRARPRLPELTRVGTGVSPVQAALCAASFTYFGFLCAMRG